MTSRASAKRYGRALFDVVLGEGQDLRLIRTELDGVAALVSGSEPLDRAFRNPAIPAARKRAVLEQLLSRSPVSPILARTLLLLADRDRLVLLPELATAFRARLMEHERVVRVEVTAAMPVPPDRVAALQDGLARLTGREVQLDMRTDPALVGGAIARIGSTVYDGSLTTQLEKLKQQLVQGEVRAAR